MKQHVKKLLKKSMIAEKNRSRMFVCRNWRWV